VLPHRTPSRPTGRVPGEEGLKVLCNSPAYGLLKEFAFVMITRIRLPEEIYFSFHCSGCCESWHQNLPRLFTLTPHPQHFTNTRNTPHNAEAHLLKQAVMSLDLIVCRIRCQEFLRPYQSRPENRKVLLTAFLRRLAATSARRQTPDEEQI
jgi:hypothetical protein